MIIKQVGHLFALLYRTGLQLIALCVATLVIILALFYTNPGAKLSIGLINLFSPYPIKTQDIEGTLAGPLTLKKVSIDTPVLHFSADQITANWAQDAFQAVRTYFYTTQNTPSKQNRVIHLKQLVANNIDIHYKADDSNALFTQMPSLADLHHQLQEILPIHLVIENFEANTITLHLSDEPINIQSLTFTRGASHQAHLFKTLSIQAEQGTLFFEQNEEDINLQWNFNIPELNALLPDLKGDLKTQGSLRLQDINEINNHSVIKLSLESKAFAYLDNHLENVHLTAAGNFEKHNVVFNANINDHQLETQIVGHLDKMARENWQVDIKKLKLNHKHLGKLPTSTGTIVFQRDTLKKTLQSDLQINVLGKNPITAKFTVDNDHLDSDHKKSFPLLGQIQGRITDLEFLSKVFPELEDINGQAALNLQVKGRLFKPIFWGNVVLKDITIDTSNTANLGTTLRLSTVKLDSTGDGILNIFGQGTMGKGRFTIEGTSDFTQASPVVDLALIGSQLTLSQTPEYFIVANPNLRLQLKNNTPYLTGTLFIPQADIETQSFSSDSLEPSSDIIVVKSLQARHQPNVPEPTVYTTEKMGYNPLVTNISVELGDKIRYKGFGLTSNIAGQLTLFTKNATLHARGKLNLVNGKYRTHGNLLNIQHGQIAFLGDQLSNPTWDIRAGKQIDVPIQNKFFQPAQKQKNTVLFESGQSTVNNHQPITVGISLKGTVREPILKMFSSPSMPEADIISYLVLNKPQREASEAQATLVLEAANELIGFLGNKRSDVKIDLSKNLKLDKFGLQQMAATNPGQRDLEHTAVVIGKQLSSKLYAEYSIRVLDTASTLSLRYLVGKHIMLEGSASKDSASGDVLFTFESG